MTAVCQEGEVGGRWCRQAWVKVTWARLGPEEFQFSWDHCLS